MYSCPGCGSMMTFDIAHQQLSCAQCGRSMDIAEADGKEARRAGNSFSMDLLTCPTCGAEIQAMNTASAAFCSYCGSSVMLERRDSEREAPETIAPFRVTREQCFEKYREKLRKSFCVDHRLKKSVTPESFRGIYVPHYEYTAAIAGKADLEGTESKGNYTYYYKTSVRLNHRYEHILHDASREMPDAMSEPIAQVEQKDFVNFSPAYLSGFYADMPDTDTEKYLPFAKAEAVRRGLKDVIEDLKDGCTYSTAEAEKKLIPMADAECTGSTLVPFWFMSIRNGKRILYAVQNGVTGEMVADMPLDIPKFALLALILTVPLYFLLNLFLTLRPEMVLVLAMGLAVLTQLLIHHHRTQIQAREAGLEQMQGPEEEPDGDTLREQLKQNRRLASRSKGSGLLGILAELGGMGGVILLVAAAFFMSMINDVAVFHALAAGLTCVMGFVLLSGRKKKVRTPAGSILAFLVMLAGTLILILDVFHSADMPVYVTAFLCLAAVVWECVDLLILHNRECSNPLPQFTSHRGGEQHG